MAETKTQATEASVDAFIAAVEHPVRRADAIALCAMMERLTDERARMWGPTMVGFGRYHYRYDSGHEGDAMRVGFAPRRAELVLYVLTGEPEQTALLARLGRHRTGKSCLYVKTLADVDLDVLEEIVRGAVVHMDARYPRM